LAIDTGYTFQLVLRTTAGTYSSEPLKIRTHKLTNLSGITVCEGILPAEQHEKLRQIVEAIGAKPVQKRCRIDTTHFICSVPEGDEWQRAKEMNIPIVVVDWIEACQREGKIIGVRGYYLDADPALRPRGSAPPTVTSPSTQSSTTMSQGGQDSPRIRAEVSTAAVDRESEKVLNTADEGAAAVTSEKTTVRASESAPKPEKSESDGNGDIEQKTEIHSNKDMADKVQGDEKFDDVPI
jgi:hypothetical protein